MQMPKSPNSKFLEAAYVNEFNQFIRPGFEVLYMRTGEYGKSFVSKGKFRGYHIDIKTAQVTSVSVEDGDLIKTLPSKRVYLFARS
jgi:hypothetical protein